MRGHCASLLLTRNGVTYRAQFLSGKYKEVQVHISQLKKFHGSYESSPDADEEHLAPKVKSPAPSHNLLSDVFQLNFHDFADVPMGLTEPEAMFVESPPLASPLSWLADTDVTTDFSGFDPPVRRVASAPDVLVRPDDYLEDGDLDQELENIFDASTVEDSSPVSILPENFGNEVGSWDVQPDPPDWSLSPVECSPTVSEVVSEDCVPAPSPPQHGSRPRPDESEPASPPQRVTRACTRLREGVTVPERNYKDLSHSFLSDDSTVVRTEICSRDIPVEIPLPELWPNLSVSVDTTHTHYHILHTLTMIPKDPSDQK